MAAFEVIALDGPSGVGKSSTARALASRLNYFYLSSGQIYRVLAWVALQRGWQPGQPEAARLLADVRVQVQPDGTLRVNGEAVAAALNGDAISQATSVLSTQPEVRDLCNQVQRDTVAALREAGRVRGVILEGRDIGTVVFPEARYKFFVTASAAERARRRWRELAATDPDVTLAAVQAALEARDRRDSERAVAPLRPAADAQVVDTSALSLEEVVARIAAVVEPDGAAGDGVTPGA